jgi:hypothetical protein
VIIAQLFMSGVPPFMVNGTDAHPSCRRRRTVRVTGGERRAILGPGRAGAPVTARRGHLLMTDASARR